MNVDIIAEKGIKGSVTDLDKFIKPNSVDEIVCNNPYNPTIKDPFELYLNKAYKVLKKDGIMVINGQMKNTLFKKVSTEKCRELGFEVVECRTSLPDKYKNLSFGTTNNSNPISPETLKTIILKKK